jgi:hypothetical protein
MLKSNGIHELEKVISEVFHGKTFLPENIPKKPPPLPFH